MALGFCHSGKDIDDRARVGEMAAVVAATGVSVAAPLLVKVFALPPVYTLPVGGLSASAATRLIGYTAVRLYSGDMKPHALPGGSVSPPAAFASTREDVSQ